MYKLTGFDLQMFGGGGKGQSQSTKRDIPAQSANEAALQGGLFNYSNTGLTGATNMQNKAISSMGNTVSNDWNKLLGNYNNTMSGVTSGYNNLSQGLLPTSFSNARQQALNSELQGTVGSAITGLGNRGILNSSVTNSALNNIGQNASDTLAKNYASDLGTYSNLLNNQASNASNVLSGNATAQSNSYMQPTQELSYANQLYNPASNLFGTLYSGRMGTAGSTTTQNDGGKGAVNSAAQVASLFV